MKEILNNLLGDNRFTNNIIHTLIIIIVAMVLYKVISIILSKSIIKGKAGIDLKRHKTVVSLLNNVVKYAVILISLVLIFQVYGVDTTSFVAGLGIAGIVVGFALQDTLRDVIGGINIVLEDYFVLGDLVEFNNFQGTIINFGLKSTKIQSQTGEVLVVANRNVDRIVNISQKQPTIHIEVPTSPENDAKKVRKVLEGIVEEAKKLKNACPEGCKYVGIERIEPARVVYAIRVKSKRGCQFELRRMVLEMIKEAYDKESLKLS